MSSSKSSENVNVRPPFCPNELRQRELLCDVVIRVGNKNFPCHRIILATSLEYFRNMLTQNYSESNQKEIELKSVNADDFELLLTRIYGGFVNLSDGNNAYRLLRISAYLNPEHLDDLCSEYEQLDMPSSTALNILLLASRIGKAALVDEFVGRVAQHFEEVSRNKRSLRISSTELVKIFSHLDMNSTSTIVLDFLVEWVKFHSVRDRELILELLDAAEVQDESNDWIANVVVGNITSSNEEETESARNVQTISGARNETDECLFSDEETDNVENPRLQNDLFELPFIFYTRDSLVDDDGTYHLNTYKYRSPNSLELVNRNPEIACDEFTLCKSQFVNGVQFLMLASCEQKAEDQDGHKISGSSNSIDNILRLDSFYTHPVPYVSYESKTHRKKECRWTISDSFAACALDTEIYVHSGVGEFYVYNCHSNRWTLNSGSPYVNERTNYSNLLSYNRSLYVIGGEDENSIVTTTSTDYGRYLQHYDAREGKCRRLPDMKYPRIKSASCIHNDVLYVSGGQHLTYYKGYIECFDLEAGKWRELETSMPRPKFGHTMIPYDNRLWFFGGEKYADRNVKPDFSWYFYDLNEGKWSDLFYVPNVYGKFKMEAILDVVIKI